MTDAHTDSELRQEKHDWLDAFKGAYLLKSANLKTVDIRRLFQRNFDAMGRASYFISVRGRAVLKSDDEVNVLEIALANYLEKRLKEVNNRIEYLKRMKAAANLDHDVLRVDREPVQAIVVTGFQTQYIKLMLAADEAMALIDLLWLEGEIGAPLRADMVNSIKRPLRRVAAVTRELQLRLLRRRQALNRAEREAPVVTVKARRPLADILPPVSEQTPSNAAADALGVDDLLAAFDAAPVVPALSELVPRRTLMRKPAAVQDNAPAVNGVIDATASILEALDDAQ